MARMVLLVLLGWMGLSVLVALMGSLVLTVDKVLLAQRERQDRLEAQARAALREQMDLMARMAQPESTESTGSLVRPARLVLLVQQDQ